MVVSICMSGSGWVDGGVDLIGNFSVASMTRIDGTNDAALAASPILSTTTSQTFYQNKIWNT